MNQGNKYSPCGAIFQLSNLNKLINNFDRIWSKIFPELLFRLLHTIISIKIQAEIFGRLIQNKSFHHLQCELLEKFVINIIIKSSIIFTLNVRLT